MVYKNEYIAGTYRIKDHGDRMGYLRLDMNENPEGLPEDFVQEVLKKITPEFLAAYPQKDRLIGAIADREHTGTQNVTLVNGSDEGMRLVFEVFTHAGGRVLTVTPTFEMYKVYAEMFGLRLDTVPFGENFGMDVGDIIQGIKDETNLAVLLNPNSPVGAVFTQEEFERIAQQCEKTGTFLLIDEAYYPFGAASALDLYRKYPHVMVLRTFSKLCSMAALRVGFLVGNAEDIHLIENAQSTYNVNSVGILFAEELLKREDILQGLHRSVEEGREYLVKKLESAGYEYYAAGGNYVLVRCGNPAKTAAGLKENGILVKSYKSGILEGWIRVTLGSRNVMGKFWEGFEKAESWDG